MKVIACIPRPYNDTRFIVEMTTGELGHLMGNNYASNSDTEPLVGKEVAISKSWKLLGAHRASVKQLQSAAKTLHALADLCEQQEPQITLTEPEAKP